MPRKPASIDDYLAGVEPPRRAALQALRQAILALLPEAEECISYSMPAFRAEGQVVAGFLATAGGCSYFPFSGTTLDAVGDLGGRTRTKSALHFTPEAPLPKALLKKLLSARLGEVRAAGKGRKAHPAVRSRRAPGRRRKAAPRR